MGNVPDHPQLKENILIWLASICNTCIFGNAAYTIAEPIFQFCRKFWLCKYINRDFVCHPILYKISSLLIDRKTLSLKFKPWARGFWSQSALSVCSKCLIFLFTGPIDFPSQKMYSVFSPQLLHWKSSSLKGREGFSRDSITNSMGIRLQDTFTISVCWPAMTLWIKDKLYVSGNTVMFGEIFFRFSKN